MSKTICLMVLSLLLAIGPVSVSSALASKVPTVSAYGKPCPLAETVHQEILDAFRTHTTIRSGASWMLRMNYECKPSVDIVHVWLQLLEITPKGKRARGSVNFGVYASQAESRARAAKLNVDNLFRPYQ